MNDRSRAYADFADKSYSWKFIERPALDRAISDEVYTRAPKVLDIGSGSGRIVGYHLRRGARDNDIIGIDPDESSVEVASGRFPGVKFIRQRAQEYEIEEATFDIVTAMLSLRYLSNSELAELCQRAVRGLRPNGVFFMLDVHPARYTLTDGPEKYFQEGARTVATPWGGSEEYHYRTLGTYVSTIANSGLRIVSLDECDIAEEGRGSPYDVDFARYSVSPARFAILAVK